MHDTGVGLTYVDAIVTPPGRSRRRTRVRFLVDSGAVYSALRRVEWKKLGLKKERELDFVLADGTALTRGVSECTFELEGRRATSGHPWRVRGRGATGSRDPRDVGLVLNPLSRTLQPMCMVLARAGERARRIDPIVHLGSYELKSLSAP